MNGRPRSTREKTLVGYVVHGLLVVRLCPACVCPSWRVIRGLRLLTSSHHTLLESLLFTLHSFFPYCLLFNLQSVLLTFYSVLLILYSFLFTRCFLLFTLFFVRLTFFIPLVNLCFDSLLFTPYTLLFTRHSLFFYLCFSTQDLALGQLRGVGGHLFLFAFK